MSILDLDVTTRRDPASIRTREFATVRKGYDPDQVRSFLDQLATWLDDLETDLATARAEAHTRRFEQPPPKVSKVPEADDAFEAFGSRVADILRTAEDHAKRIREEAEASVEHMLDEARQESQRMRTRAQEETDAMRTSALEYAESTRRAAQEEADRVREDAATALENARVEAERTVAGLTERRSVLAAELHATRTRLMGIVTQLEEDADDESFEAPEDVLRSHAIPATGYMPPDDPRRDSVTADDARREASPPELPAFVPPPAPPRASVPEASPDVIEELMQQGWIESAAEGEPPASAAAEEPVSAAEMVAEPVSEEVEVDDDGDVPQADSMPDVEEEPPARRESFLQWTNEEVDPPPIDMSLPDFPSIDIPTLDDDETG